MGDLTGYHAPGNLFIGSAGWAIARASTPDFPAEGAQLERYASVFRAVEINSSFHRAHRRATYARWASSVPASFRFSVKLPKTITHAKRLVDADDLLGQFLDEVHGLGDRLGCLLVQLPPSLEFDASVAERFFEVLRAGYGGEIFLEPRDSTWFERDANALLKRMSVGRVAADPAVVPAAGEPGGAAGKVYFRLHGSPEIYQSSYTTAYIDGLAFRLRAHVRAGSRAWCMFDNTMQGAAVVNALCLARKIVLAERGASRGFAAAEAHV